MAGGGSACGRGTALVRMVQANSVVESKATTGLPSAAVWRDLRREGAYETMGVRARCPDPSRKCSARASSDAGKERTGLVPASESLQCKEDREGGQAKGRKHAKQMAVE